MGFLSIFTGSSVVMGLIALICAVVAVRCLLHGIMGGTSTLLRILGTVVFVVLAYYFWRYSTSLHGANVIDTFVFDIVADLKSLIAAII